MDPLTRKLVETVRQITEGNEKLPLNSGPDQQSYGLVRTLPSPKPGIHQTLHVNDGKHYVVSSSQNETVVFPADSRGKITDMNKMLHAGDTPQHGQDGFNIQDHHIATFSEFTN